MCAMRAPLRVRALPCVVAGWVVPAGPEVCGTTGVHASPCLQYGKRVAAACPVVLHVITRLSENGGSKGGRGRAEVGTGKAHQQTAQGVCAMGQF